MFTNLGRTSFSSSLSVATSLNVFIVTGGGYLKGWFPKLNLHCCKAMKEAAA